MPTQLTPHLACRNAAEAAEFYGRALGAQTLSMSHFPDGKVAHAALSIDGAIFYLSDEFPEYGSPSPLALGGSPVVMHLHVEDCDAFYNRAVEAGCTVKMPLDDMFWGDRYGVVVDPYGHKWAFATTVRQVSSQEAEKALAEMLAA